MLDTITQCFAKLHKKPHKQLSRAPRIRSWTAGPKYTTAMHKDKKECYRMLKACSPWVSELGRPLW